MSLVPNFLSRIEGIPDRKASALSPGVGFCHGLKRWMYGRTLDVG